MNSFRIVLLVCLIGLAYAQFDWDKIRDILDDDQYELYKKIQESNRRAHGGNPFENNPFGTPRGNQRNQKRQRGHRDSPNRSKPTSPDASFSASDCVCRMKSSSRIVGGETVTPNSIPWQVSLASYNQHFCGGSIVNKKFVLTAAHCIDSKRATQVQVRVGLHKLTDANQANTYEVAKIHMHPYTSPSKPGDYALLELKTPITYIPGKVEPGCINTVKQSYDNDLIASGWGTTSISRKDTRTGQLKTGELSPVLKKAILHEDEEHCEDYLVCVNSDNKDSVCQGDSGGPLHYLRNGRATIEGVASFVTGQSKFGAKTVEMCTGHGAYSANHYYKSWFEKIVGQSYCKL